MGLRAPRRRSAARLRRRADRGPVRALGARPRDARRMARRRRSSRTGSSSKARPARSAARSPAAPSPARLPALLRYRHETLAADLAAHARVADRPRLTVGITGASGLVGTALTHFLTTGGHRVVRFVRGATGAGRPPVPPTPTSCSWDPQAGFPAPDRVPATRRGDPPRRRRRRRPPLDAAADGADPRQPRPGHGDARPRPRRPAPSPADAVVRVGDRLLRLPGADAGRRDGAAGAVDSWPPSAAVGSGRGAGPRRRPARRPPPARAGPHARGRHAEAAAAALPRRRRRHRRPTARRV